MKKTKKAKKTTQVNRAFLLPVLVFIYVISSGVSYVLLKDKFSFESTFITEIEARQALSDNEDKQEQTGRLYEERTSVAAVKSGSVPRKDRMLVIAEDTIRTLLEETGANLLDLYLDRDGVIYIDFSDELKKNYQMDIAQELNFLGRLFNGIRTSVPGLTAMKLLIGGKEVTSLGGHIDISKPIGEEIAGII